MLHACGEEECEVHEPGLVAVSGTASDNIVDGMGIAVGYMVSPAPGLILTLAVVAHEIPQGIVSVHLLRRCGFRARGTFGSTLPAGSMYVVGALLGFIIPVEARVLAIAFVAGAFLYIGLENLPGEPHRRFNAKVIASVVLGALLTYRITRFA